MTTLALQPIRVGTASASTLHAADLGKTIFVDGAGYRLVRASANITAAANKVVIYTDTGAAQTVNVTTTASAVALAGVIPAGQVGSTGTTTILSGDYFYVQISGIATPIVTASAVAAGTGLATNTTSGEGAAVDATFAATEFGATYAVLLVASSGTSQPTRARLVNLI